MNIKKFIAPTTREALQEIRNQFGGEAVILSNRKVEQGVEIIALANEEIGYVTGKAVAQGSKHELREPADTGLAGPAKKAEQAVAKPAQSISENDNILGEIKSMYGMLQQQLAVMSWAEVQRRDPQSAGLMTRMISAGFSTQLARQLLDKMPAGKINGESWVKQILKRNLHVAGEADDIVTKGGVYALIGPTGVGKTTTTAKLAARAVVRYGADKVALITTDGYRIGAYDQLKIYGKILGVAVHAVKDTDDLRLTISALRHKHLVLIDTVGMGQRDGRVGDQNEMLDAASVPRLLLLNAASSGDTLEDVVCMYHSNKVIGCIPTKLDEAVNLGAVLDVVVRHRLIMHYMANGQSVPEDLHPINLDYLLHRVLKPAKRRSPFALCELEFPALMGAEGSPLGQRPTQGRASGDVPFTKGSGGGSERFSHPEGVLTGARLAGAAGTGKSSRGKSYAL